MGINALSTCSACIVCLNLPVQGKRLKGTERRDILGVTLAKTMAPGGNMQAFCSMPAAGPN